MEYEQSLVLLCASYIASCILTLSIDHDQKHYEHCYWGKIRVVKKEKSPRYRFDHHGFACVLRAYLMYMLFTLGMSSHVWIRHVR